MKGPGLYFEIGKKARDLLNRDYSSDQKLTFSTCTQSGLGLTSSAVKKDGIYANNVSTQYKYKNTVVDVKLDSDSNISSTLTVLEVLPSTKAITTFKLPDFNSGKLEVQYFHDRGTFAAVVGLSKSPTIDVSTTIGAQGVAFGAEAGFDTTSKSLTKYSAGLSFTKPNYIASIILENKGDTIRASLMRHVGEEKRLTVAKELIRKLSSNENIVTVGGSYALDSLTTVKARLNNNGIFGALLQHELIPKSVLTISGEFNTKSIEQHPRFGIGLVLKP